MRKKVCMFVWNHFTNDARVLRECTALSESNYEVDLICIHDPNEPGLPRYQKYNDNFTVHRVRRYPITLEILQGLFRSLKRNKLLIFALLYMVCLFLYAMPLITSIGLASLFAIWKLRGVWIKGNIILRMTTKGYFGKYDIYHSNDLNTLPQGYFSSKLRLREKKLIYDSHEVQTSRTGYNSPVYGIMEKFFVKRIDSMITENHTRADYNEHLYGFYPNVVHNYPFKSKEKFNKVPLREILDLPENEKILLYQGGIQTGRGLDKLIQATPLFKEGTLVLIGDGKIKTELQKMVNDMNLNHKVKFLPKVPLEHLPNYTRNGYLGFQVLNNICFNHYSASSNKLFEYMSSEVPVVACDFPEIKKVVEGEKTGICVDSHDYKEIAEAVNALLTDKELYESCRKNARYAKDKYNWEVEKKNFLKIYENELGA